MNFTSHLAIDRFLYCEEGSVLIPTDQLQDYYFNASATAENLELSRVPARVTEIIITTAISAAISPYSIAVTPSSSLKKFLILAEIFFIVALL